MVVKLKIYDSSNKLEYEKDISDREEGEHNNLLMGYHTLLIGTGRKACVVIEDKDRNPLL